MMESVFQYLVAGLQLFWSKRNLCQIVLPFVGIVLCAVCDMFQRISHLFGTHERVTLFIGQLRLVFIHQIAYNSFIAPLPVVHILTLTPLLLEGCLTLRQSHRVVEIPSSCTLLRVDIRLGDVRHITATVLCLLGSGISLSLFLAFFLLFLLQSINHAINGFVAVFLRHLRQLLQRVLQMYSLSIGHQFVKHNRTFRQLFVVVSFLVQQTDGFTIAPFGVAEFLLQPIQVTQMQEQYTFLDTASCSFLIAFLVGSNRIYRIFVGQIDITNGIIYLIQVIFVLIRCCHTLQTTNHLLGLASSHHLRHRNTGIELQFVRRILANDMLESLICLILIA